MQRDKLKKKELFSRILFPGCYYEAGKHHLSLKFDQQRKQTVVSLYSYVNVDRKHNCNAR